MLMALGMADIAVKLVQVDVGKYLAGKITDRSASDISISNIIPVMVK